jgi:hypothetical protein
VTGVAATFGIAWVEVALGEAVALGGAVALGLEETWGVGEARAMLGRSDRADEGEGEGELTTDEVVAACQFINGRLISGISPRTGKINQGRCFSQLAIACRLILGLFIEFDFPHSTRRTGAFCILALIRKW